VTAPGWAENFDCPLGSEVPSVWGPEPYSWSADLGSGYFVGRARVDMVGARRIVLVEDFTFVEAMEDGSHRRWYVPADAVCDGSSIPWLMQRWMGSPLVGLHRFGSIPHDYYCITKTRSSADVHRMYLKACRASADPLAWFHGNGVIFGGTRVGTFFGGVRFKGRAE
jgi:hypothetical protein